MPDSSVVRKFYFLFHGNRSYFVKHKPPFALDDEGKLKAKMFFAKYNEYNPPPDGYETGDYVPVTQELYREHLNGRDGIAVTPLTDTDDKCNVCFYGVIDIDVYGVSFTHLVRKLYRAGFRFSAFLSKSGGLHIYFFFESAEPADRVIDALKRVVETFGLERLYANSKRKSKVEVFPKQAVIASDDNKANCLFLPFYNAANSGECKTKMLSSEGKLLGIAKALPIMDSMLTSLGAINSTLDALPYNDAPYCIQTVLLTGALAENDGRNNFLFSAAKYLKKKYKEDFYDALAEMNDCLEAPLEERDIKSIYKSVTESGYENYSCKKSPCVDYCDKKLCAKREFSPHKERGNRFTGADCWGDLSKVMAEEPYYLWQVRVRPDEDFRTVRLDSVDDLQSQSAIQKRCWRDLNWAPFTVKVNDWIVIVNKAMEGIEERQIEVSKETDTSNTSALRGLFLRYLTQRQVQNGQPHMVKLDLVYHADGAYYFTSDGFKKFLALDHFPIRGYNLREQLISYGCTEGEVKYTTKSGVEKRIPCWKKMDDDELLDMDAFYDDVYEADTDALQKRGEKKEPEPEAEVEDTRF